MTRGTARQSVTAASLLQAVAALLMVLVWVPAVRAADDEATQSGRWRSPEWRSRSGAGRSGAGRCASSAALPRLHVRRAARLAGRARHAADSRAGGDLFTFVTDQLTVDRSNLRAGGFAVDLGIVLMPKFDVVGGFDMSRNESGSEYRRYIASNSQPITQVTRLNQFAFSGGVRFSPVGRGRRISRYAFIPQRFTPYAGAGASIAYYSLAQHGQFVDFVDLSVFTDWFASNGWSVGPFVNGGVDVQVWKRLSVTFDGPIFLAALQPQSRLPRLRRDRPGRVSWKHRHQHRLLRSALMIRTHVPIAAALLAIAASLAHAQPTSATAPRLTTGKQQRMGVDPRWSPWLGCRTPAARSGASPGTQLCIVPSDDGTGVRMITFDNDREILGEVVIADGTPQPMADKGCSGQRTTRWSTSGLRLFSASSQKCADEPEIKTTGLSALVTADQWIDVQVADAHEREQVRVHRFWRSSAPAPAPVSETVRQCASRACSPDADRRR